jgi:hypothetical protein
MVSKLIWWSGAWRASSVSATSAHIIGRETSVPSKSHQTTPRPVSTISRAARGEDPAGPPGALEVRTPGH